jgi:PTS system nitrogen regulatory IIA component
MDNDHILVEINPLNKRQLLQKLSEEAAKFSNIDERIIFDALLERENLGSTGFGNGTAVPHARIAKLDKTIILFAKLEEAIDFESVDNKPIDLAFLLLSPENNGADHLTVLANISRVLKNAPLSALLRKENNKGKILNLLND